MQIKPRVDSNIACLLVEIRRVISLGAISATRAGRNDPRDKLLVISLLDSYYRLYRACIAT